MTQFNANVGVALPPPAPRSYLWKPSGSVALTMPTPTLVNGKPVNWQIASRQYGEAGVFVILVKRGLSDVTGISPFRGVMPIIDEFTYADPFEDATAQITFPQITAFDSLGDENSDVWWLEEFTNLDIYWLPGGDTRWNAGDGYPVVNPRTGALDWYIHHADAGGNYWLPLWEGYIATIEPDSEQVKVTCQGVFYQLDRYYAKPFYWPQPWPMERLIQREFSKSLQMRTDPRKGLLAKSLENENIHWPQDWARQAKNKDINPTWSVLKIDAKRLFVDPDTGVGENFTGYSTRNTGNFQKSLTGYVQQLLAMMYVAEDHMPEVNNEPHPLVGSQWTLMKEQGERRRPCLQVRDKNRPYDFTVWYGQPGVEVDLNRDGLSKVNVVFGEGTGFDGSSWRSTDELRTKARILWKPIAKADSVPWPYEWASDDEANWPSESYQKFTQGVAQDQAERVALAWIARDSDPGWSGSITLQVDPIASGTTPAMSYSTMANLTYTQGQPFLRWRIRAGMVVRLHSFLGAANSIDLHIAEVTCRPEDGTVTLRVDSKFRDLLTLEEVQAQTRDPLTPVKALQINKYSQLIDDVLAPWDYSKGSGFIPKGFLGAFEDMPNQAFAPWQNWLNNAGNTPNDQFKAAYQGDGGGEGPIGDGWGSGVPHDNYFDICPKEGVTPWYVPVNAGADNRRKRWSFFPIRTAQAGEIYKTELYCYDGDGNLLELPFHFSVYYTKIQSVDMPAPQVDNDKQAPYPFFDSAFESRRPDGLEWTGSDYHSPPPSLIIGWGNKPNPAGYSPGRKSDGGLPTGMLVDSAAWSFNNVSDDRSKISPGIEEGAEVEDTLIQLWGAIFCELEGTDYAGDGNKNWVYFAGRMYKKVQGTGE